MARSVFCGASSSAGARHRQTLPRDGSCEADANKRPSGENRKASTVPLCLSVIRSSPVGTSQITTLLSALPEAKVLPSGEKAKVQTKAWCFFKTNGFIVPGPSSGQRSISPLAQPTASMRPSGEKATLWPTVLLMAVAWPVRKSMMFTVRAA